ncbi:hypothetical protein G9F71_026805 [Clostridium sp. FP2]|uniref:hypothetical protein n=1 Tax=Clostridium sp. FP2 TaxID=2724481 RepID=UPI001A9A8728|nr:hypothetical protein [Clostridium sp. FP2]MBZ9626417.1 hypothetical protein [Clostridium sp. FP2]
MCMLQKFMEEKMRRLNNRKLYAIVIILIVIISCISVVSYNQYKKIKRYEDALQNPLSSALSNLGIGINENTYKILTNAINNKYINKRDACFIGDAFYQASISSQQLFGMALPVSGYNESFNNQTSVISRDFSEYVRSIIARQESLAYSKNDASILIRLTDDKIIKFEKMKEITNNWLKILKIYIPSSRSIVLVKDNRWINLVNDFSDYANKLKWKPGEMISNK